MCHPVIQGPTDKAFCGVGGLSEKASWGRGENRTGLRGSTGSGLAEPMAQKRQWRVVLRGGVAGAKAGSEAGKGGRGLS